MTDTIEAVAEAIRKHQAENRVWKMADLARAAITAHTKALIEGAGELVVRLRARARLTDLQANQDAFLDAAATIAAQKAEIERLTEREAQVKLDGVNAGIEASAEIVATWGQEAGGYGPCGFTRRLIAAHLRALDAEAIAKGEG